MYTCNIETVQQNGCFTPFSSKFPSNIYSILFAFKSPCYCHFSWDTHPVAYYASEGGLLQGRIGGMRGEVKCLNLVNFSKKNVY